MNRLIQSTLSAAACVLATTASAQEVVRLGNLKLAHFGAVSYMTQLTAKCGIKVDEKLFAKGPDVMQAMVAGELDAGATASEASISARAVGVPIYVVAGFAKGGARLVAAPGSGIKTGCARAIAREVSTVKASARAISCCASS